MWQKLGFACDRDEVGKSGRFVGLTGDHIHGMNQPAGCNDNPGQQNACQTETIA